MACDCGGKCKGTEKARARLRDQFPDLTEAELKRLFDELVALGQKALETLDIKYVKEEHVSSIRIAAIRKKVVVGAEATAYMTEWALHIDECSFCTTIVDYVILTK